MDIPQTLVEQVRKLRKAAVYVDGRRIEATQVTIFPEADPATNTFRTRVDLPANAADLYPGMFVKVGFVTGESPRLLVPKSAIVARSEVTAVYVVDGERAHRPSARSAPAAPSATGSRSWPASPPASAWRSIRWRRCGP